MDEKLNLPKQGISKSLTHWHKAAPLFHGMEEICYSYAHEVTSCGVLGIFHGDYNSYKETNDVKTPEHI